MEIRNPTETTLLALCMMNNYINTSHVATEYAKMFSLDKLVCY